MTKKETKEVAVVKEEKTTALAVGGTLQSYQFEGDVQDILIPKLLVGQSTSQAVQEGKVLPGQIYRSTTMEALGGKEKPVSIIPLHHYKTWVVMKKEGGRFVFKKTENFTHANRDLPWEWTDAEGEWKREQNLNFYVLVASDVEKDLAARREFEKTGEIPDADASLLPCLLAFKSTSYKVGKVLVTHFAKAADFGAPPYGTTFKLSTEKQQNGQGIFQVLRLEKEGKTNPDFVAACSKWYQTVKKSNVKVDDSDLQGSQTVDVPDFGPEEF